MGNVNAYRKGQRVVSIASRRNRLAADFPGWGAADAYDFLVPMTAGLVGTVTSVESHGSNPWTRYVVEFDDGTRGIGLVDGEDFFWATSTRLIRSTR